jgi:hypothetical protein
MGCTVVSSIIALQCVLGSECTQFVQESIKASSQWFIACALHARGMAQMMLQRIRQLQDFAPQLHVIYLVNDIFFSGCVTATS